jgi:hypothetical protein
MPCARDQDFIVWHDSRIKAELSQFLDHAERKVCLECMDKHLTRAQAYAEENLIFTGNTKYLKLARRIRDLRKLPDQQLLKMGAMNAKKILEIGI